MGSTIVAIVKRLSNLDLYEMPQGNPNTSHNLDLNFLQVYSWDDPPTNLDLYEMPQGNPNTSYNLDLYEMPQGNPNTSHNLDLYEMPQGNPNTSHNLDLAVAPSTADSNASYLRNRLKKSLLQALQLLE